MTLKTALSQGFLLSLIALMGLLFVATLGAPDHELWLTLAALALIALSLGMERIFPLHQDWNKGQKDVGGDVAGFVLIFGVLDSALKWLTPFVLIAVLPQMAPPSQLPLWMQILAVTLLIEFGAWLSHYAHHRFPRLWALHAMHHSTERLYTMNNFRFHPLNHVLTHLLAFVPPLFLGFAPEAVLGYAALAMPILLFQHSNIRFEFGALDYLLNTNALHRWHHSSAPSEGTRNLGRALVIWDHLFGTYLNPGACAEPRAIGLFRASRSFPPAQHWARQIFWPFCKRCCA